MSCRLLRSHFPSSLVGARKCRFGATSLPFPLTPSTLDDSVIRSQEMHFHGVGESWPRVEKLSQKRNQQRLAIVIATSYMNPTNLSWMCVGTTIIFTGTVSPALALQIWQMSRKAQTSTSRFVILVGLCILHTLLCLLISRIQRTLSRRSLSSHPR